MKAFSRVKSLVNTLFNQTVIVPKLSLTKYMLPKHASVVKPIVYNFGTNTISTYSANLVVMAKA